MNPIKRAAGLLIIAPLVALAYLVDVVVNRRRPDPARFDHQGDPDWDGGRW